jgi:hypothetical protein
VCIRASCLPKMRMNGGPVGMRPQKDDLGCTLRGIYGLRVRKRGAACGVLCGLRLLKGDIVMKEFW